MTWPSRLIGYGDWFWQSHYGEEESRDVRVEWGGATVFKVGKGGGLEE